MRVLVVGGAGFIGSHLVHGLRNQGDEAVVLDNLLRGHRELLPNDVAFYQGEKGLILSLDEILKQQTLDAVVDCSGLSDAQRSQQQPLAYYHNDFTSTCYLLQAMLKNNLRKFIYSSSLQVFGMPETMPINAKTPRNPTLPLGKIQRNVEDLLEDIGRSENFSYCTLRLCNVAGASHLGFSGVWPEESDHLIPAALEVALGKRQNLPLYGTHCPQNDGTPIREYLHVDDVVDAYLLALKRFPADGIGKSYNLGSGNPISAKDVISKIESVTGKAIAMQSMPTQPLEADSLFADSAEIRRDFQWQPRYDLQQIIQSAWDWRSKNAITADKTAASPMSLFLKK